MIKFILWTVTFGAGWTLSTLALMWVAWDVHAWWAFVPLMDFDQAFGVTVTVSILIGVWRLVEMATEAVNEL